jgi:hypothetical protein
MTPGVEMFSNSGECKMIKLRFMLPIALVAIATAAFAQSHSNAPKPTTPSDAQKSFDAMKALAGDWEGRVNADPPLPGMDSTTMHISMRVTSRGNALVHEMQEAGKPLDPAKYDHPVTMFYLDSDHLNLVHYCDAGNRPHMIARSSPDGKKIEFDFVDLSGSNENGHMYHAVFTIIDSNHHLEDWTYMMPGDKPMHGHFDLKRTTEQASLQ